MVFAIHQHESATGVYVSPRPEPTSHLPPHPIPLGCPSEPASSSLWCLSSLWSLSWIFSTLLDPLPPQLCLFSSLLVLYSCFKDIVLDHLLFSLYTVPVESHLFPLLQFCPMNWWLPNLCPDPHLISRSLSAFGFTTGASNFILLQTQVLACP